MNSNKETLKSRGFIDLEHRRLWVSPDLRMAFSYQAIRDYSPKQLRLMLDRPVDSGKFYFCTSNGPDDSGLEEFSILKEMRLSNLQPETVIYIFNRGSPGWRLDRFLLPLPIIGSRWAAQRLRSYLASAMTRG